MYSEQDQPVKHKIFFLGGPAERCRRARSCLTFYSSYQRAVPLIFSRPAAEDGNKWPVLCSFPGSVAVQETSVFTQVEDKPSSDAAAKSQFGARKNALSRLLEPPILYHGVILCFRAYPDSPTLILQGYTYR